MRTRIHNKSREKPTAILTSDIHLRISTPKCRVDDFFLAQERKISFLKQLQESYQCPIFDAGDLFHKWSSPPFLESWSLENLPNRIITVPGNHELPYHSLNRLDKSSLNVLKTAGKIEVLTNPLSPLELAGPMKIYGFPFGMDLGVLKDLQLNKDFVNIAILHILVYENNNIFPDMESISAKNLMDELKGFDLIVTGHNHLSFTLQKDSQILVNVGSLMRSSANQVDYKPRIFLWYFEKHLIHPIEVPIISEVMDIQYLEEIRKRDDRIDKFIENLTLGSEKGLVDELSFEGNLDRYYHLNKTRESVQILIKENITDE